MGEPLSQKDMNLLAGRLSRDDIPAVKAHVIRIYLCSTGTDSMTERDQFVQAVYPKLREFCKDKYGLEFQVVDLAWGLSPAEIDAQTDLTPLRIHEIQRCHALSAGPNFIAFIGQKYGPRALPDVILAEEYDLIRLALHSHKGRDTRNAPLLDKCYVIDDNNIPPVYILKDKTDLVDGLLDNNMDVMKDAQAKWEELQEELRTLLKRGAELAYLDGTMDSETKDRYHVSELENQIALGMDASDIPRRRCVLITRNIDDLGNYTNESRTPNFAEVRYDEREDVLKLDQDSANMLLRLRNRSLGLVTERNAIHHDVLWRYEDVISPKLHREYLDSLNQRLFHTCVRLINESAPAPEIVAGPCEEATHHWARCRYLAANFHKQESSLRAVQEYLTGHETSPLVIYGPPGCGKSKLMSRLAYGLEDILSDDYIVVLRYLGYTTKSHDLKQLLLSLCTQVTIATGGLEDQVPIDMSELGKFFTEMLASFPVTGRLVILLDGLELLSPDHNAFSMAWLPASLPPHVKLVLTVHPSEHDLLPRLKEHLAPRRECFLEIQPISVDDCEGLLMNLLLAMDRTLSPVQIQKFRKALEGESLPLFVELLANIAKDLNSFTNVESLELPRSCEDGIEKLFGRLEEKHGRLLVSRAFAYMVASSSGLSDCEMEDILSLDEDVLNEVFRDFHPPVRRIPYIKWLALKQDVEAFLAYRDSDGVTVAIWQHDSLTRAVRRRYLSDEAVVAVVHSNIADYFLGTWARRAKPVPVVGEKRLAVASYDADRRVPEQPHTYGNLSRPASVRFNKRKYDQVPRHLDLSGRHKELNSLVFFNYEWLYSKIKALSLQHIMADFALNPSDEASLVEEALRRAEPAIERDINCLPLEISGHLLPYYATCPNIRSLIRQCDTDGLKHCAMVPNFPNLQVPGSSLKFTLECPAVCETFMFQRDDTQLVCKKRDDAYVHVFDLETGELKATIFASNGELHPTPNGKYLIVVDHITEKSIKIHDASNGAFLQQIIAMNHLEGKSRLYKKGPLCVTNDRLCTVVTLNQSVLFICEIPSGKVLHIITLDGKSDICQLTPDGRRVFCNSNSFLVAYDVYTLQSLFTVPLGTRPSNLVFTHDGLRVFLSNNKDTRLTIMHLNGDAIDMTYRAVLEEKMPGDKIQGLTVSPNDSLLLVRGKKSILVYHRGLEKIIATFQKPEDVPEEFRLPRSHYVPMTFTHAQFTQDSNFVAGSIFRHVYVWQISSGTLVTTIQAPIGLITSMLVSSLRPLVITHMQDSKVIQVWSINQAVRQVHVPDKLTDVIHEVQVTSDNNLAFIRCRHSDELGVIDMRSGDMMELMTHDAPVDDFAMTPSGDWCLVSTSPRLQNTAFKLWNMEERRVMLETGNSSGYCVGPNTSPCIVMVAQKDSLFKSPYHVSVFHFVGSEFYEHVYSQTLAIVRSKPFLTADDQFLVVHSAQEFDEITGNFVKPCICTFHVANGMQLTRFDGESLKFEEHLLDILQVRPCYQKQNGSLIAAIISCKDHYNDENTEPADDDDTAGPYGFFLLDAKAGSLILLCIPFPRPNLSVGSHPLIFSKDCSMCLDEQSNIFHISTGEFMGKVVGQSSPPQAFALNGRVVVYFSGQTLDVVQLSSGVSIARCDVHARMCTLHVCSDERTLLVGCEDGTVLSYTIIDPEVDHPTLVLSQIGTRKVGNPELFERSISSRSWDKVEDSVCPGYTRPPSAINSGPRDKMLLRKVKAIPRHRPKSDTSAYNNAKTHVCAVM